MDVIATDQVDNAVRAEHREHLRLEASDAERDAAGDEELVNLGQLRRSL